MYAVFNGLYYVYVLTVCWISVDAWVPHSVSKLEKIAKRIFGAFLHPT